MKQEPVGYVDPLKLDEGTPLYTAPRELSDLTEQIKALQAIGGYWYDGQVRNQYIADTCFELTKIINEAILKKASEK
jgi:hypothetical protein